MFKAKINKKYKEFRSSEAIYQNVSNNLNGYFYIPLLFLLFLSITSGYLLSDIFLGLGSDFFSKIIFINPLQKQIFFEKHFEIFFFKYIPIICSIFFFLIFDQFNLFLKKYKYIYYFFKLKIYFDFAVNFFLYFLYKYTYTLFFKQVDKSFLEILGPFGIIRYFYFLTFNLNKLNLGIFFNYICLFFFFFSFFLLF
jgi:NADH-ubiquinone oxidoreductase chain 5